MPFVGRAAQLGRLESEFQAASAGGSRVVVVCGDPGVGKTRLLVEFQASLRQRARCLVGRGSPLGSSIAFSIWAEALESHLRTLAPSAVATLCGSRLAQLAGILPSVGAALGGTPAPGPSRLGTIEAFLCLVEALAQPRPLVLCLDDVHQADPSTLELLSYLGRNPLPSPVLLVLSSRAEALLTPDLVLTIGMLLKDGLATELRLEPLTREETATLAHGVLGVEYADPSLADWLFHRTSGNPLFAVALLQELASDPSKRDPARRVVPVSVRERVRGLALELSPEGRRVLDLAAVLGHSFTVSAIAQLLPAGAGEWLDELTRKGLLQERAGDRTVLYDFVHPLVQEAIYEGLGSGRRRELHLRVAQALDGAPPAVRAHHAARGALPGDRWAVALILEAAREAERNQTHREALTHLQAALDLVSARARAERAQLLDEIAWQASCTGDHTVGIPALRELAEIWREDRKSLGLVHMRQASFLSSGAGDLGAAEAEALEAIRLLRDAGAVDRLPAALNELAWIRGQAGDVASQVEGSREAAGMAEAAGDRTTLLHALGSLGHALALLGRTDEAVATLQRSLEMARTERDASQITWHSAELAEALAFGGRFAAAAPIIDDLFESGFGASDIARSRSALINWFLGRWTMALADCRALQALYPVAPPVLSAWALSLAGLLAVARGQSAAAEPYLAQADRLYAGRPLYWFSGCHDWAVGAARWLQGNLPEARERLGRAVRQLERIPAPAIAAQAMADLVEILWLSGEATAAEAQAERLAGLALGGDNPFALAMTSYANGLVEMARGRRTAAAQSLRAAAEGARGAGARFMQARAMEHLGHILEAPERAQALGEASRLYGALPAPGHERRALAALRGLGSQGKRTAQGVGALTLREREVAALARRGLSTRAIADQLSVSERTIETHLAHIYGKLGISGRQELLAQGLARQEIGPQ